MKKVFKQFVAMFLVVIFLTSCKINSRFKRMAYLCGLFMVSGFLLSVAIESFQYYFCLGRAETDDVICNTLGCVLGVMANVISYRKRKQFTKV